jgi:EAL domain-containing protein (putative c-di-GMP-specific phosphodiesterase class I)
MKGESGELTGPNEFLPVAHEFGLSTRVDQWVIEHTLAFMDANRRALPGLRLAINLSPVSLSRSQFRGGRKRCCRPTTLSHGRLFSS